MIIYTQLYTIIYLYTCSCSSQISARPLLPRGGRSLRGCDANRVRKRWRSCASCGVAWLVEVPTTLDLRENLQENPIFHGKNQFPVDSTNQSIANSIGNIMARCHDTRGRLLGELNGWIISALLEEVVNCWYQCVMDWFIGLLYIYIYIQLALPQVTSRARASRGGTFEERRLWKGRA